jgi:hypothetical protein
MMNIGEPMMGSGRRFRGAGSLDMAYLVGVLIGLETRRPGRKKIFLSAGPGFTAL